MLTRKVSSRSKIQELVKPLTMRPHFMTVIAPSLFNSHSLKSCLHSYSLVVQADYHLLFRLRLFLLLLLLLLSMEKEQYPVPPSEIQTRVNSRRGGNNSIIHPVEMETPNHQVSLAVASSSSPSPVVHGKARPFKKWWPWLIPAFVIANVVMFIITMYVNNCPKNYVSCIARFLGRFSFQPFKENPLLGPSSIS